IADYGGLADHDAHAVIDKEAPPYLGAGMDFDACQPAADMGNKARQPFETGVPAIMADAVNQDGVNAGVGGNDFENGLRRRVTLENAQDVFFQSVEHVIDSFYGPETFSGCL